MRRVLVLALIAAAVVALAVIWPADRTAPQPNGSPTIVGSTSAPRPAASFEPTGPAPTASPSPAPVLPSPAPSSRSLQGRDLAVAWLRGYLTRSSREDDRWEAAIADLSSPELVAELQESGPDRVGFDQLRSWKVAKIEPYLALDQPVDTPSRTTLAYAASVTDGRHTVVRPFILCAYLQVDDRWLITDTDQPYLSEG